MYDVVEKDTGNVIVFKATEYPHCKSIQNIQWGKASYSLAINVSNYICLCQEYGGYGSDTKPVAYFSFEPYTHHDDTYIEFFCIGY